MKAKFELTTGLGILAIALVALLPFVSSTIYNGLMTPISIINNQDSNIGFPVYNVNLVAYGDANGCVDTDKGVYPQVLGSISWFDPRDANMVSHVQPDFCDSNTTVVEMACVKDIKINGVQYQNYFVAVQENCADINKTVCITQAGIGRCI